MKRLAFILGIMCLGLIVFLKTSNKYKKHYHPHFENEDDKEEVWWG